MPRETLEEIDLKIKAARQLIDSDSIDALKLADGQLRAVEFFLNNIDKNPELYKTFGDQLLKLDKKLKKFANSRYEVSQRVDLQTKLDKLRKDYVTKPQKEVQESIIELGEKIQAYKNLVIHLGGKASMLEKQIKGVESSLSDIGETLKKKYSDSWQKYDGYYGSYNLELADR